MTETDVPYSQLADAEKDGMCRALLAAYAAIDGHASLGEVVREVCPPPSPRADGRTREHKAWTMRTLYHHDAVWFDLHEAGCLEVVEQECGGQFGPYPWGLKITEAGRAHLADLSRSQP